MCRCRVHVTIHMHSANAAAILQAVYHCMPQKTHDGACLQNTIHIYLSYGGKPGSAVSSSRPASTSHTAQIVDACLMKPLLYVYKAWTSVWGRVVRAWPGHGNAGRGAHDGFRTVWLSSFDRLSAVVTRGYASWTTKVSLLKGCCSMCT